MAEKMTRRSFMKTSAAIGATSVVGGMLTRCSGSADAKPILSVVKGDDPFTGTAKAVEQLGGMEAFVPSGSSVALLPNAQRNNPGAFTNPDIVRSTIKMCFDAGAKEVNVLSWLPEASWESTGLKEAITDAGGNLVLTDMNDENLFKPVPVPNGKVLKEVRIMKALYENDIFIDMPITKDHAGNKFTGTMKNMMGLNYRVSNRTFHKEDWKTNTDSIAFLDQCIADLNTVVTPDLCIVDATEFITTNGPFGPGELLRPQKVVAGTDRVAIDAYCCALWGLDPQDIFQIKLGYEHKLGQIDLNKVNILELEV